jgi:hypothetical protein
MPIIAVTGMRQTDKSTFLKNQEEFQGLKYVTIDDFAQLAAARENPDGFVNTDTLRLLLIKFRDVLSFLSQ